MKKIYVVNGRCYSYREYDDEDNGYERNENIVAFNDEEMAMNFINNIIIKEIDEINSDENFTLKSTDFSNKNRKSYTKHEEHCNETIEVTYAIIELELR